MNNRILRGFRVALVAIVLFAGIARAQSKLGPTPLSDVPWSPKESGPEPKVIYGSDDRIDVYQETDTRHLQWAHSTCALISGSRVTRNSGDGSYTIQTSAFLTNVTFNGTSESLPPCAGERFANQPVAAFCSGWLAGDDTIVTAGHCVTDNSDLNSTYFVFGFDMIDANTPVTHFNANQVYQGVALLGHELDGDFDYSVIQVDRVVTSPGAVPFDIRRADTIAAGTPIGVIGHPTGLPTKIAFGGQTAVRDPGPAGYFVANLDTYGGNSGSPVINAATGIAEGILVRGDTDFVPNSNNTCGQSNVNPNDGGSGEQASKTTSFMQFVPEIAPRTGVVALDSTTYTCTDTITVTLSDGDLRGAGTASVTITSTLGDSETLSLTETAANSGRFKGQIDIHNGTVAPGNHHIEVSETATINVTYHDASTLGGQPGTATASAIVDCTPPVISNVTATRVGGGIATVNFDTGESSVGTILYGLDCDHLDQQTQGVLTLEHSIRLNGLSQLTQYFYAVEATDVAGNVARDDNGGACYSFTTVEPFDYFTAEFSGDLSAYQNRSFQFTPDLGAQGYKACGTTVAHLPLNPPPGNALVLADDDYAPIQLTGAKTVPLYGVSHTGFYVGSNGYITFDAGDSTPNDSVDNHFASPRVSGLFTDLNPGRSGSVLYAQLSDRAVVTYLNVPNYDATGVYPPGNTNTVQIELFFSGVIRITFGTLFTTDAIAGLSEGGGTPSDYEPSDFAAYPSCFSGAVDSDGDGISDLDETTIYGTDPNNPDTDGDGIPDGYEVRNGLNPLVNDAGGDLDGDGLTNGAEYTHGTRANVADSDRDGVSDGAEVQAGTDPTGAADAYSADTDGNHRISLGEIARVVQLFNAAAYSCSPSSEDGFQPGPGPQNCARHSSDYDATPFSISLAELLRTIELFNARGYARDLYSVDTFAPLP